MACGRSNPDRDCQPRRQQNGSVNRRTPSLFRAKRINHCNDFVARVALEVVDSSLWKQQLRVKSAGSGKTAISSNEGASRAAVIRLREFLCQPGVRGNRFCNTLYGFPFGGKSWDSVRRSAQRRFSLLVSVFDEEILP